MNTQSTMEYEADEHDEPSPRESDEPGGDESPLLELYVRPGHPAPTDVKWAGREREWFHESFYHCLPLQMANQLGWTVGAPADFSVRWNGGDSVDSIQVRGGGGFILSYFGFGTFTYTAPFVIRTPAGINLLVKGVANRPKDGCSALEGYFETDNLRMGFTFNFRLTRPNVEIHFKKGEPLAQFLPYPRHFIERFAPRVLVEGERYEDFVRQSMAMEKIRRDNNARFAGVKARDWKYLRGEHHDGTRFPEHQKKLKLKSFEGPAGVVAGANLVDALRAQSTPLQPSIRSVPDGETAVLATSASMTCA